MNVEQAKKAEKKMEKKYGNYTRADYARYLSSKGHVLVSLQKNSKQPLGGYKNNNLETNDKVIDKLEKEDINYGSLGQDDKLIVDVDLKDHYSNETGELEISEKEAIRRWNKVLKEVKIPRTTTQKSANGKGQHYFFKITDEIRNYLEEVRKLKEEESERKIKTPSLQTQGIMDIIDTRHGNGYVVAAGSEINGNKYKLIDDCGVAEMPFELFQYLWNRYPGNQDCDIEKPKKETKKETKKENTKEKTKKENTQKEKTENIEKEDKEEGKEIELYKKLLKLIDYKYVDNYQTSISIIWSVASEGEELKEITHEIMRKSGKYTAEWVNSIWEEYDEGRGITIGTALHYAKISNKKEFMKIIKTYYGKTIDFDNLTDENLGNVFITIYGEDFLYYEGEIYKWNGVFWNKADREDIIQIIFDKMYKEFVEIVNNKYDTVKITDPKELETKTKNKSNAIKVINRKMANSRGAKELADTIKTKMRKQQIDELMNNNWNLFVFNNKVYDLEKGEFIEPKREQYMTISAGYKYEEPKQKDIDKVNKFLSEVIEDEKERDYYLKLLSTTLEGRKCKNFIISNGEGGNGKSILHECLGNALGNYAYDLDNSVIQKNGKKDDQSKANIQFKRFVKTVEPNKDTPLDSSLVKAFTGNDVITARHLYSTKSENVNHGTYLMECNNKPKFDEASDALERRLVDFRFKVIFKDDIKRYKDIKQVKKANSFYDSPEFKNKIKCAWFYVLANKHREFMNNKFKLDTPKDVKERTKNYLQSCGELNTWLSDHLVKSKKKNDILRLMYVYNRLKNSDFWRDLPKKQRRDYSYKELCNTINSHFLWKLSYYERKKINGKDYKNVLLGYNFIENPDDESYDSDTDDDTDDDTDNDTNDSSDNDTVKKEQSVDEQEEEESDDEDFNFDLSMF